MSKFGREDIKTFIRNFKEASWSEEDGGFKLLNECGCEESPVGLEDNLEPYDHDYNELAGLYGPMQMQLSEQAPCPDSYNSAADLIVQVPEEIVELLKPLMEQLNIGCPASLAKAMGDVLTVSQENGITPIFHTGDTLL